MLGCEECRDNFEFYCLIREVMLEAYGEAEATGETLDRQARHWMTWMRGDKPSNRSAVQ